MFSYWLNCVPQNNVLRSEYLLPENLPLFGDHVIADVIT